MRTTMLPTSVRFNTNRECQHMSIYSRIYSNLCSKGKFLKEQHRKEVDAAGLVPTRSGSKGGDGGGSGGNGNGN